jgi:hypothetical protein
LPADFEAKTTVSTSYKRNVLFFIHESIPIEKLMNARFNRIEPNLPGHLF